MEVEMQTVFIAGSMNIRRLHPMFADRIATIVRKGMPIVVGDASGADASIQAELVNRSASDVTVFCTGDRPRNNLGDWPVHGVRSSARPGSRANYTAKDLEMAKRAVFGLMLWDAESVGTLNNVLELLSLGRKCVVFLNRETRFLDVRHGDDVLDLVGCMSDRARTRADRKIRLGERVGRLSGHQSRMAV